MLSGRTTHGAPFDRSDRLGAGDPVVLVTQDGRITDNLTASEVVAPTAVDVSLPVPGQPDAPPTERLLYVVGAAVACAVSLVGSSMLRRLLVRRYGVPAERRGTALPTDVDVRGVELSGPGGSTLRGLVLRADPAVGTAVVVHGWGGSAADLLPVGRLLRDEGLDVLLLDARGHGRSDDTDLTSMPHIAEDLAAAVGWWRTADLSRDRLLLVGHSVGAGACLLVARGAADVAGVVLIASMAHPRAMMQRLLAGAGVPLPFRAPALHVVERLIGHRFDDFAPLRILPLLDLPVVVAHGERDRTVPVEDARALAAAARDGELVVVPGAGHSDLDAVPAVAAAVRRLLARTAGQR